MEAYTGAVIANPEAAKTKTERPIRFLVLPNMKFHVLLTTEVVNRITSLEPTDANTKEFLIAFNVAGCIIHSLRRGF